MDNSDDLVRVIPQCCVCRRVRDEYGNWSEPVALIPGAPITHTYCPGCYAEALREIEEDE